MNSMKTLPYSKAKVEEIISKFPTPFHIYDEAAIVKNAEKLKEAFSWNKGFKEYYAVKAAPNPHLLEIMKSVNFGGDCSSMAELMLCEQVGITGENIMFTSNQTPAEEYQKALELGAVLNLDDITHIDFVEKSCGKLPDLLSFRYNPGDLKEGNDIIGEPLEAKYGLTREQMIEAYKISKERGVKRFGIHTMVASNELNEAYFAETAEILFDLVVEVKQKLDIDIEFANLGGGLGIPYKPEQKALDLNQLSAHVKAKYESILIKNGISNLALYLESGRYITGPFAQLITKVVHFKDTFKKYAGVDASMADLMRPGMYGAYHHITVLGKESDETTNVYDVVGSLCENNDKFAVDRNLPKLENGDLLAIHDTGAHGHAMGFNYNGKLRPAELLLKTSGEVQMIRRAETYEDLFATLNF